MNKVIRTGKVLTEQRKTGPRKQWQVGALVLGKNTQAELTNVDDPHDVKYVTTRTLFKSPVWKESWL